MLKVPEKTIEVIKPSKLSHFSARQMLCPLTNENCMANNCMAWRDLHNEFIITEDKPMGLNLHRLHGWDITRTRHPEDEEEDIPEGFVEIGNTFGFCTYFKKDLI